MMPNSKDGTLYEAGMEAPTKHSDLLIRLAGFAGLVGPIAFVIIFTILEQVSPGYSPLTQAISNLELVQNGWIQQLNFLQFGILVIVFAIGFRQAVFRLIRRRLRVVTILLILSGTGPIIAAYFTPAYPIQHTIGFFFLVIPLITAFFLIGKHLRRTDSWRKLGNYSLASGFVTVALLLIFFSQGASSSMGLVGLVNRIWVIESFAWFAVMGASLLRKERK